MEEKDEHGIGVRYDEIIAALTRAINGGKYSSFDDLDFDDSEGIINKVLGSGVSIPYKSKPNDYKLYRDMGYFIYWLMMNYEFLVESGYESPSPNTISHIPSWGRSIINSGRYNEIDKFFLNDVREWMIKTDWVYKKPELNEHNDYMEKLAMLPTSLTYNRTI
jgi:hypothetical protein